jgi:putative nucleotidyltransferase with HDIG domain
VVIADEAAPDGEDLMAKLVGLLNAPGYAPPVRPTVALELLELVKRDDTSADAVVALLERDMVVAGRVLQLAASPLYSSGQPARTLRDAIVRLGTRAMAEILFQVWTTTKVFRAPGYERPMDELRLHSTAVAYIARIVCRRSAHHDEYAFLCGLLHDVGIALALIAVAETSPRGAAPSFEELQGPIAEMHEQAGGILCRAWKLPDDVRLIVENHHHPMVAGRMHPIIAALRVAEEIAVELGVPALDEPRVEVAAREALGLGDAAIARIAHEARAALEAVIAEAAQLAGRPPPAPVRPSSPPPAPIPTRTPAMGTSRVTPRPASIPPPAPSAPRTPAIGAPRPGSIPPPAPSAPRIPPPAGSRPGSIPPPPLVPSRGFPRSTPLR